MRLLQIILPILIVFMLVGCTLFNKEKLDCNAYLPDECPDQCALCADSPTASYLSCHTEEFCTKFKDITCEKFGEDYC